MPSVSTRTRRRSWLRGITSDTRTSSAQIHQTQTDTLDLPYDIWKYILGFLPVRQVTSMISINRACFDAAMDERYRNVEFNCDHPSFRYFMRLQDPTISRRVRNVQISSEIFYPNPDLVPITEPKKGNGFMRFIKRTLKKKIRPKILEFRTKEEAFNSMAQIFFEMAQGRLESMTLDCELEIGSQFPLMLPALLQANIERLKHITVYLPRDSYIVAKVGEMLAEFIIKQRNTLRSLELLGRTPSTLSSPARLVLKNLGHCPSLQRITLRIRLGDEDVLAFREVIESHKHTLTDLEIYDYQPATLHGIRLPALEYLVLGDYPFGASAAYTPEISALLKMTPSLHILKLPINNIYSYNDARTILNALASCRELRVMAISLENLSPQILDRFHIRVPSLMKLTLRIGGYTDRRLQTGSPEQRFCEGISSRKYEGWGLFPLLCIEERTDHFDPSCSMALKQIFRFIAVGSPWNAEWEKRNDHERYSGHPGFYMEEDGEEFAGNVCVIARGGPHRLTMV
ncbi:hypothetical protein BDZ94DRAFT_164583 [Collybia nuda]|uniref:F-box domain-containing protein n=1 Tax=Collybia nuda TaxID=64659 RepID=A0A9P5XVJ3_9AGAR|nr:hypothetical protein BDZ94DRAFT_164583 [Collybia nuda]